MFLETLNVEGYKGFSESFAISFQKNLNVIVGENASGKTAIIDAIRLLLREDEFGFATTSDSDFHSPIKGDKQAAENFRINAQFGKLSDVEKVAFLPWSDLAGAASLSLQIDNKEIRGRYKRYVWGGASKSSIFEWGKLTQVKWLSSWKVCHFRKWY